MISPSLLKCLQHLLWFDIFSNIGVKPGQPAGGQKGVDFQTSLLTSGTIFSPCPLMSSIFPLLAARGLSLAQIQWKAIWWCGIVASVRGWRRKAREFHHVGTLLWLHIPLHSQEIPRKLPVWKQFQWTSWVSSDLNWNLPSCSLTFSNILSHRYRQTNLMLHVVSH